MWYYKTYFNESSQLSEWQELKAKGIQVTPFDRTYEGSLNRLVIRSGSQDPKSKKFGFYKARNPEGLYVPNPSCGGRKPVELLTDRAKRYRANSPDCRPEGPQVCMICSDAAGDVMHLDGNESNMNPDNLAWGCRSCNTRLGKLFTKLGKGVKTRQYNPAGGAQSVGAWLSAIQIVKHGAPGDLAAAVQTIRETPAADRSRYQSQAWAARKRMYGRSGRSAGADVPF